MLDYLGKNGDFLHIFLYLEKDGVMWYLLCYRDILWKIIMTFPRPYPQNQPCHWFLGILLKEKYPLEVEGISKEGRDFWKGMGF